MLILPVVGLGAALIAIGLQSARYRKIQATIHPPFLAVLITALEFMVVLVTVMLTKGLGYI